MSRISTIRSILLSACLIVPSLFLIALAADSGALLNQARALVQKHRYDESRAIYQSLLEKTSDDKEKASLERELNFILPYYEAEHYFQSGALEKAQTAIVSAIRANKTHPDRLKKLKTLGVQILAARQDSGAQGATPDEKTVAKNISNMFKDYYRTHGGYPPDYQALNQLLPPEQGMLHWYDVLGYKGGKHFYSIQLKNRYQTGQVLDLSGGSLLK